MELNYGPRFLFRGCLFLSCIRRDRYFEIFIFATSGLNFFKEEKGWTIIGKDLFSRLSFEEILSRLLDTRYGLIFIF